MTSFKKGKFIMKKTHITLLSGCLTFLILAFLFYFERFIPAGTNSCVIHDAKLQYLDFFSYFKDLLTHHNNISYSFSKGLGGPMIGVFSYYLSSPLNLLVVFFKKSQLVSFYHLLVLLKVTLASITASILLTHYYKSTRKIIIPLSTCYALGQYSIAQASNILWLDGVYMLPLMLLGVAYLVNDKKGIFLCISTGCSILFNWYTGGINCLFSIMFFLYLSLLKEDIHLKNFFYSLIHFGLCLFTGVLLSSILFLPTIGAMTNSTRGSLELNRLFHLTLYNNPLETITASLPGERSVLGHATLYCGTLPAIGCVGALLSGTFSKRKRMVTFIFLFTVNLLFYFHPLYFIFSLLKYVSSYWYRYSYVAILSVVFISADYYLHDNYKKSIHYAFIYTFILFILSTISRSYTSSLYIFIFSIFITAILLRFLTHKKTIICLSIFFLIETSYGVYLQLDYHSTHDLASFPAYQINYEKQWDKLSRYDKSLYRINQNYCFNLQYNTIRAKYNEGLAFHLMPVATYTSSPDDNTREFLDHIGYRLNGENLNVVNESILASDSLLGVKYISSTRELAYYKKLPISSGAFALYENPYALPLSYCYKPHAFKKADQPFDYLNNLYQSLTGIKKNIYEPISYTYRQSAYKKSEYDLTLPQGHYLYYGHFPIIKRYRGLLQIENYKTRYGGWLSPSLFPIPVQKKNVHITITGRKKLHKGQFYALNLDILKEMTDYLKNNKVSSLSLKNGEVLVKHNNTQDENILISIPYDQGWDITLNNKKASYTKLGDCFYSIPVKKGHNVIRMTYHVKYAKLSIITTIIGLIILYLMYKKSL
jgi:uncharacterized membrane protein YfhO